MTQLEKWVVDILLEKINIWEKNFPVITYGCDIGNEIINEGRSPIYGYNRVRAIETIKTFYEDICELGQKHEFYIDCINVNPFIEPKEFLTKLVEQVAALVIEKTAVGESNWEAVVDINKILKDLKAELENIQAEYDIL